MAIILVILMIIPFIVSAFSFNAYAVTQADIDAVQKQKDEIAKQKAERQAVVDKLEEEHASALEKKLALDARNQYTLQQIELNNEQLSIYAQMIADKAQEVEQAKELELKQLKRYRTRVRAMEERGNFSFLDLLVQAKSFGELLTLIDDIGEIMKSDRELEDEYIAARENTEAVKAEYEQVKTDLEAKQDILNKEQEELEAQIVEAYMLIREIEENLEEEYEEYEKLEAAEDEAREKLDELSRKLAEEQEARRKAEEERRRSQGGGSGSGSGSSSGSGNSSGSGSESGNSSGSGSNSGAYATGSFTWPVPSCTYITSRYGQRVHPVTGEVGKMHYGLDIGAGSGSTIVAADGGTVIVAYEYGGYGNCVMIDHGNGYTTVYGHMSSIAVGTYDTVYQGQTIGYVGSTGVSNGPHCHFEIRYNGSCIDPADYFGGLTFAPDA